MLCLLYVLSPVAPSAPEQRITRIERELAKIERSLTRSEVTASETREQIKASKAQQVMFEAKLVVLQNEFKEQLRWRGLGLLLLLIRL